MSNSNDQRDELLELANRHCEGRLSDGDSARMYQLLRDSAELRECFLAHRDLHASLSWNGRGSRVDAAIFTESLPAAHAASRSKAYRIGQYAATATQHLRARPLVGMYAAAAALVLLFGLGWWIWPASPVARMTRVYDVTWAADAQSLAAAERQAVDLAAGQRLHLNSGLAEVRFRSGAKVVLEGPATFDILGENAARLDQGKLVAQVPPVASGFEITTPAANVIDRGTEFALWVQPQKVSGTFSAKHPIESTTEVHVFTGQVEVALQVTPESKIQNPKSTILSDGKAVRAEGGETALAVIEIQPERFIRTVPGALVATEDFESRPPGALGTSPGRRTLYERTDPGRQQTIQVVEQADMSAARIGRHVLEIRDDDATRKMPGPVFDLLLPESLASEAVQIRFDFRILNPASHPLVTVYNRSWYLELGPQVNLEESRLGSLESGRWYRATLDLPAVSPSAATARVRIEKLAAGRFIDAQTVQATHVRNLPGDAVRFGFHSPQIQSAGGLWQIDNIEVRAQETEEPLP